jgi:hypothetical protein
MEDKHCHPNLYFKGRNHRSVSLLHANKASVDKSDDRPIVNTITIFVVPVHLSSYYSSYGQVLRAISRVSWMRRSAVAIIVRV